MEAHTKDCSWIERIPREALKSRFCGQIRDPLWQYCTYWIKLW